MFKQSQYDFEVEKIADDDLTKLYHQNMFYMASIYMALKKYSPACFLYEQFIDMVKDDLSKSDALIKLMYIFTDEKDWSNLRRVVDIYDTLNLGEYANDYDETVDFYKDKLIEVKNV